MLWIKKEILKLTDFLWNRKSFINTLLFPFSILYYLAFKFKFYLLQHPKRLKKAKVICVGNCVIGGSGKTPTCIALHKLLHKKYKIAFISRGYKARLMHDRYVVKVDKNKHSYRDVGDEPLLLSEYAPTYICIDRYRAGVQAEKDGAELIIMDDGLQNNTIIKDIKILVIDQNFQFGNGLLIPAGPCRDLPKNCMKDSDVIIRIGSNKHIVKLGDDSKTIYGEVKHLPIKKQLHRVICLSGIAKPTKFLDTVKKMGLEVIGQYNFPDHHCYSTEELEELLNLAEQLNCKDIVTTEKDYVKIPKNLKKYFTPIKIELHLEKQKLLGLLSAKQ
jgi:tetraacyldisaccharide 4'-kinase